MKRLTKRQMRIFAVGQLGWSTLSGIISAWFVTFYLPTQNDIKGGALQYIMPGLVIGGFLTVLGLITALSRVFDAVTDPLIASLSDRSKNKRGRRIPFMQYAAVPLAAVTVLLFCAPVEAISSWNIVWISVFIVLFYLFIPKWWMSLPVVGSFMLWWAMRSNTYHIFGIGFDIQVFAMLALIPIYIHTNSHIKMNKWVFYLFYPGHMIGILLIEMAMKTM